jgi:uncharacterized membrane protein YkoI
MAKQLMILLLAVLPLALASTPVTANDGRFYLAQHGKQNGLSLNQAVQQVKRETGGRILSADTVSQDGRAVHRIKVLTPSGQVRIVTIDAQSGSR